MTQQISHTEENIIVAFINFLGKKGFEQINADVPSYIKPGLISSPLGIAKHSPDITGKINGVFNIFLLKIDNLFEDNDFHDKCKDIHQYCGKVNATFNIIVPTYLLQKLKSYLIKNDLKEITLFPFTWNKHPIS